MLVSECCEVQTIVEKSWRDGERMVCSFCYQPCEEKRIMDLKGLIAIAEKAAPVLAGYLGGPMGNLVVSLIATAYGVENKFDYQAMADQIAKNPYKLKELEISHREHVGDGLVSLLEKVEGRASNALLWVVGMGLLVLFAGYVFFEMFPHD